MNGNDYRVRITAREKVNSDTLYIVDAEILQTNKGNAVPNNKNGNISALPFEISIADLVNGVKIYDYATKQNDVYSDKDVKYSFAGENALIANKSSLENAKSMNAKGMSSEDIRLATGWHKGYDGKWRFEIDDSQMG